MQMEVNALEMTNNVVSLNQDYARFGVRNVKIKVVDNRFKTTYHDYALIVLINTKNKREIPHPLTTFVYEKWKRTNYNTQYARAKHVASFLNYIAFDNGKSFKLLSLADLKIEHAIHFLDHKVKNGCSRGTIQQYDSSIMYFYQFLCKKGLLHHFTLDMFKIRKGPKGKPRGWESLFFDKLRHAPMKTNSEDKAKTLAEHHLIPFIHTALQVAPDIALGVYMSCFGGLRGSEVVSVKRSRITSLGVFGENGLIVKLETDSMIAQGSNNRVKSPGKQPIDAMANLLRFLYEEHLKYYPEPKDDSDSLFVNKWGKAMQYQNYRTRFNKVRDEFINKLLKSNNSDDNLYGLSYMGLNWSTHIGRGIYSNRIAEQCHNLIQLMQLRRDSSPYSAIDYLVSTKKEKRLVSDSLEEMYEKEIMDSYNKGEKNNEETN